MTARWAMRYYIRLPCQRAASPTRRATRRLAQGAGGAPGTWHGHERPQGVAQHPARRRHRHATTIAAATPRAYLEQHHRALFRERHCFVQYRKGSTHGVGDGGDGRGQCERPLVLGGLARPTIPRHGGPSARHWCALRTRLTLPLPFALSKYRVRDLFKTRSRD